MAASTLPLLKVRFDHKIMLYVTNCKRLSSDMSMKIYEEEEEKEEGEESEEGVLKLFSSSWKQKAIVVEVSRSCQGQEALVFHQVRAMWLLPFLLQRSHR